MNARADRARLLTTLVVGALAVTALGCKQSVLCPELGACGGPRDDKGKSTPPLGEWFLQPGHPSCTEDLYVPANDTRLGLATLPPVGTPYPEPALFDWCLLLVTNQDPGMIQRTQPRFFYESGQIGAANIRYEENGHYTGGITRTGTFTLVFPPYCVRAFGAQDNVPPDPTADPSDPLSQPADICKQLQKPVRASGLGEGSYRNTTCEINPEDDPRSPGCICTFDVTETGSVSGFYSLANNQTIVHLPGTNFPQRATFCQRGDTLELTGADGAYLFDQRGLRTFDLVRSCPDNAGCVSGFCDMGFCGLCREDSQCSAPAVCNKSTGYCK